MQTLVRRRSKRATRSCCAGFCAAARGCCAMNTSWRPQQDTATWRGCRRCGGCCRATMHTAILLHSSSSSSSPHAPPLGQGVLDAAAASNTMDAVAKMEWVLDAARGSCRLTEDTAAAAARSGDLGRLRWLQERGCPMGGEGLLLSALQHADLTVVQWLVDEARCCVLPEAEGTGWEQLLQAAARSSVDGVDKLRWLQERGAPPLDVVDSSLVRVALEAAKAGQAEVVRSLLPAVLSAGPGRDLRGAMAATSGSIPVVECLQEAGLVLTVINRPYQGAATAGSVATVRWLAQQQEGIAPTTDAAMEDAVDLIKGWPTATSADSRSLLEAVRVVLGRAEDKNSAQVLLGSVADRGPGAPVVPYNERDELTWNFPALMRTIHALHAVSLAAHRSDVTLVRYLMAKLSPTPRLPEDTARKAAVEAGCEAMLEWLVENRPDFRQEPCPGCVYLEAARNGDRATLTTLRRLGVPWGLLEGLAEAVRLGCCVPALRWLVEQGVPVGGAEEVEAAVQAAVRDHGLGVEAAAWLRGLAAGGAAAATGEG